MPDRLVQVVAVRHGETAWNVDARIQGDLDVPLNAHGRWQAEALAQALRAGSSPIDAIYSSDLQRALETANVIGQALARHVMPVRGLRERGFGVFQGKNFAEAASLWPEEAELWRKRDPDFAPEGGESLRKFGERVRLVMEQYLPLHMGKTVLIVAHGGVLDALYRAAMRLDVQAPRTWSLGNAAINRLLWSPEGLSVVGWGDDRHLTVHKSDSVLDEPTVV